jgi:hypothetical protein
MNLTGHENMTICGKHKFIASYAKYYSITEITPVELLCCWKVESFSKNMYWISTNGLRYKDYNCMILSNIGLYKYDMIYLLTAIGLTPSGSSTLHIYTQTVHRTTQWNRIHSILHALILKHNNKNT